MRLSSGFRFLRYLRPPGPSLNVSRWPYDLVVSLKEESRALDLGSGSRRLSPKIVNLDIFSGKNVDIIAEAEYLPFADKTFDVVICTAVFEYIRRPNTVMSEIRRILSPSGLLYIEVPFLQGVHAGSYADSKDYYRYTLEGLNVLCEGFEEIDSGIAVGPSSALLWILREYAAVWFNNSYLYLIVKALASWIFFPLKYLDIMLVKRRNAFKIASGFFYLGRLK
jgi:SAM-dependent methyltransferase